MASPCPTTRHAQPSEIEIEEGYNNLDKLVSRDCVPDIWVDALKSIIQELDKEASQAVLEPEVYA